MGYRGSQRSSRYPDGYILLAGRDKFCRKHHTIDGVNIFMFFAYMVRILWEKQIEKHKLLTRTCGPERPERRHGLAGGWPWAQ